jgi:hypothetical protein
MGFAMLARGRLENYGRHLPRSVEASQSGDGVVILGGAPDTPVFLDLVK